MKNDTDKAGRNNQKDNEFSKNVYERNTSKKI